MPELLLLSSCALLGSFEPSARETVPDWVSAFLLDQSVLDECLDAAKTIVEFAACRA